MITVLTFLQFTCASPKPEKEPSVYDHRMGELTVKAKPGASVTIEQVAHEFWFGCAIPNSLADGSMSETDKKQFEEKFLAEF
jgi:endo-1,4-beta-xylanase